MLTLKKLPVDQKKVLLRVDFNVPLDDAYQVTDDSKIQASIPTLLHLIRSGARVIAMSHLGRPKGKKEEKYSLRHIQGSLERCLGMKVDFADDCIGPAAQEAVSKVEPGKVLLLENLRFHVGEESPLKDPDFIENLASLGEVYVDDAFGAMHRKHASVFYLPEMFSGRAAIGLLAEKEVNYLNKATKNPLRPFFVILGGSKVSTKLGVLKNLLGRVDALFIGGAMAYTFLKAQGYEIGESLIEPDFINEARDFLQKAKESDVKIYLPLDHVIASPDSSGTPSITEGIDIPNGKAGFDIGPKTVAYFGARLASGKTFFWNGPVGVFEKQSFAGGTLGILEVLKGLSGIKIAGGGDTLAAIKKWGFEEAFSHISTGGGATLEYIEYGTLPGIEALKSAEVCQEAEM